MKEVIETIIKNVLTAIYQPFAFAVLLSVLFMFFYMFVKEYGVEVLGRRWLDSFKTSKKFRRVWLLAFYTSMILFKTLLNRSMWPNPLLNIVGVWGLYRENGSLTTEVIENLILFVPFTTLLLCCFKKKILGNVVKISRVLWQSVKIVFLFSLLIELLQLLLCLGTFQLSDLFYNTLGGFIGGCVYWIGYKIAHRNKKDES